MLAPVLGMQLGLCSEQQSGPRLDPPALRSGSCIRAGEQQIDDHEGQRPVMPMSMAKIISVSRNADLIVAAGGACRRDGHNFSSTRYAHIRGIDRSRLRYALYLGCMRSPLPTAESNQAGGEQLWADDPMLRFAACCACCSEQDCCSCLNLCCGSSVHCSGNVPACHKMLHPRKPIAGAIGWYWPACDDSSRKQ